MQLDHITFACQSLELAQAYAQEQFGVELPVGGVHPAMATHNLFTRIAPNTFLEFIAIDPAQAAPKRPRWFNLDDFERSGYLRKQPRLIGWVTSVKDIDAALLRLPFAQGSIVTLSRANLSWRMSIPIDGSLPFGGIAPTLIEWSSGQSPVGNMRDVGISLGGFEIHHPSANSWHAAAQAQGWSDEAADHASLRWCQSKEADLVLKLHTPKGVVQISKGQL